jgi:hypothetical protein
MKKILKISIILLLFGVQANAQQNLTWGNSGATWIYGNWSNTDIQNYLKMTYTKDTVVMNQPVKKIELTKLSLLIPPAPLPIGSPVETYFGVEYMYESNDTVYRFNPFGGFSFDILYVFNPVVGDIISIHKREDITHPCNTSSNHDLYEVDSVFTISQGTQMWSVYRTKSNLYKWTFGGGLTEGGQNASFILNGIGSYGSPFPFPISTDTCPGGDGKYPLQLTCYRDSINGWIDLPFGNGGFTFCEDLVSTSTKSIKKENMRVNIDIYPNPVHETLTLEWADYYEYRNKKSYIQIFDSVGKLVKTEKIVNEQSFIDVNSFPSGVYFLRVVIEDIGNQNIKFIKY